MSESLIIIERCQVMISNEGCYLVLVGVGSRQALRFPVDAALGAHDVKAMLAQVTDVLFIGDQLDTV